jgi:hypothetical protein
MPDVPARQGPATWPGNILDVQVPKAGRARDPSEFLYPGDRHWRAPE